MTKDNVVTFEELFRLLQDRQRYQTNKDEVLAKIQALTTELEKARANLEGYNNMIATGEAKSRAIGRELGAK